MKILYLTMDGFDTPGPNNQMAMVMIRDFLKAGHQVHLIQSHRKGIFADIPDMLQNQPLLTVETLKRNIIDKNNFILRYLNEAKWAFQSFRHWRKVKDVDVIFLQSCPSAIFQILLLKFFSPKPVLFNIYDVWPGHAMDLGVMKHKWMYNTFRYIQKIAYKCCTKIAVLSEDMEQKLINEGVPKSKIRIVPAWFDDSAIMNIPREKNKFIKKFNLESDDSFIVQFAGTIGYVFNYKLVLDTAEKLLGHDKIRLQIIGDGLFKEQMVYEASERCLSNIDFYPLQPIDIVPDVYSACDVCIIPLRKGVIGNGVPSKAPLLMACHKTIINSVESDSEYYKIFNENNMGISVPLNDSTAMSEAILHLYNNPDTRKLMGINAEAYSRKYYSASVCTKKFIDIFEEMNHNSRRS